MSRGGEGIGEEEKRLKEEQGSWCLKKMENKKMMSFVQETKLLHLECCAVVRAGVWETNYQPFGSILVA